MGLLKRLRRLKRRLQRLLVRPRKVRFSTLETLPVFKANRAGRSDGFHELIAGAWSYPSRDDFKAPDVLHEDEINWARLTPQPVKPLGYYKLSGVSLCGEGYVLKGSKVCYAPSIVPAYWRELLEVHPHLLPVTKSMTVRKLRFPSILFVSRDYNNYMHWWMEIVPRLYPLWLHEPALLKELAVVIPSNLSWWCRDTLSTLFSVDPSRFVTYDPDKDVLRCKTAILPTMMHTDYHFHPAAADFYRYVMEKCRSQPVGVGRSGLLFLTRRHSAKGRVLANILEVEALAVSMGFELIAPETLSWQEQVSLFSRARIVAGEHGAAMKNLLFAPSEAIGIVINYVNETQATLSAVKNQRCVIVAVEGATPGYVEPFTVDIQKLRACLKHGMRLAGF